MRAGGVVAALLAGLAWPAGLHAQVASSTPASCEACHGELEFLRQHTPTLADARRLLATEAEVQASAHTGMECAECHEGAAGYPHRETVETQSCASCHEGVEEPLAASAHGADSTVVCASCHGVHDVPVVPEDGTVPEAGGPEASEARGANGSAVAWANEACASCHLDRALGPADAHVEGVSCAACHGGHEALAPSDVGSGLRAHEQAMTCGACHVEASEAWTADVHGQAAHAAVGEPGGESTASVDGAATDGLPGCSGCHGGHGMLAPSNERFDQDMVDQCAACHQDYADTYFGTYHGKVTALGSDIAATCNGCHGSHGVFASDDARSLVHADALVETCGECHEQARPAFVLYDSHPNPFDRERNAPLHYSFIFMNALLVGVLGVFALHTLLWWRRILIERREARAGEGPHG